MTTVIAEERATKPRGRLRVACRRCWQVAAVLGLAVSAHIALTSYRHGVPLRVAAKGVLRTYGLEAARLAVAVYDPCTAHVAETGPSPDSAALAASRPIEEVFPPGGGVSLGDRYRVETVKVANEKIVRSPYRFAYQPYDEPRLQELARKYRLSEVVARGRDEFEGMVLLRNWSRSQFRRSDYQPLMFPFDALAILDRGHRNHGEPYRADRHFDPCHFFPKLYCQLLLSVGHQARLVSADHGMAEVWSNQYRKWVLMDAELNHHFEKDGAPLNMVELLHEHGRTPSRVRIVRGEQSSGDENTTLVHLGVRELSVPATLDWFVNRPLDIVEMRNDWLTNNYFPGHPARSERSALVLLHPDSQATLPFESRLRTVVTDPADVYWTLNQTTIRTAPPSGRALALTFDTVTPNFRCFEVVVDGGRPQSTSDPTFQWHLHDGRNTLTVRTVNQFGVRGVPSTVELSLRAGPR